MAIGKFRMISAPKSGIGGFLLLFIFTQVVSIGLIAWYIPGTIAELSGPDAVPAGVVLFFQAGRGVAYIIGLVLLFRRDPRTPKFYQIVFAGVAATMLWEAMGGRPTYDQTRTIIACVIWFLYWRMSARVRLTFAPKTL